MPKFNLLSYIMPPEDKMFFELFQNSAEVCSQSATLYEEIMHTALTEEHVEKALKLKKKGNRSFKLTLKQLNKSFITPIEREDIQHIAALLHRINKKITKACVNLKVYRITTYTNEICEQAKTLVNATSELKDIISKFKKVSDLNVITKANIVMKEIESHGDEILHKAIDDLFSGQYDAIDVIKYRDIYKEIENALDSCYAVSDAILNIVLKQS